MTLIVDPRTPNERSDHGRLTGDLHDMLTRVHKLPTQLEQIDFGDAACVGNGPEQMPVPIGVELKRVGDVLQCIQDGRFSGHQLPGLVASYKYRWLVLEGPYKKDKFNGLVMIPRGGEWVPARPSTMYSALEGWLLSQSIFGGMRVWHTYDRAATARFIARLYTWWQEPWESHTSYRQMHIQGVPPDPDAEVVYVEFSKASVAEQWARALPGVGDIRARAAAKEFGSPLGLALATQEMWEKVKGIGKHTAEKVVRVIRGEG